MQIILIFLCGVLFSAFGTVVGFGGGIFMIPVLIIFFNVPINIAVGSVILALLPGSLISTYFNYKNKKIDYLTGIFLEVPTIIGTILGSLLTAILPLFSLEIIFSVFVSIVGIYTFRKGQKNITSLNKSGLFFKLNRTGPRIVRKSGTSAYRISVVLASVFGMVAGMMSGLFGIGGGFLKTPIMVNVFGIPPSVAAATALFMIVFTSLTGSISHYMLGHLDFTYSLPIVAGFIVGAFVGNHFNLKISEKTLASLIGFGLLLAGAAVLINAIVVK
ncbi:MAG TPA: sulfite exporter TauE/SafE family protein [Ignavibacteriaceae bacterium]|nr:sulfite exporter TauE/SafE family protein [Ignavibacteriaceae bacterium]